MGYGETRRGLYDPQTEHDACGIGFVAHIRGEASRSIVEDALLLLRRLSHRGATGCDPETGDGAGVLLQIPHGFMRRVAGEAGIDLPRDGRYGVGQVFLPTDPKARAAIEAIVEEVVEEEGQRLLGWRDVPVDPRHVGQIARDVLPVIRQVFVGRRRVVPSAFERKLYVIRKRAENLVRDAGIDPDGRFHVCSLSARTIVYKGLFTPHQLQPFYADLQAPDLTSAIAVVHSRFSTNTFPTWDLAQPFRFICHNGEINTVRGNRNWTNARHALLQSAKFWGSLDRLFPIIVPGGSDSAQFDNMLELLHLGGRSLPHAMMLMIPEAWENHELMDEERHAYYEYAASLMEPWDGPAAIAFTDGRLVGATLDRNGLRPARYVVTDDDRVILASEVGALDIPADRVRKKGRLQPGRMLLVDTDEERIVDDAEVKADVASRYPFRRWLLDNQFRVEDLPDVPEQPPVIGDDLRVLQRAFGYTEEDLRLLIEPMARAGEEPVGSMGTDTPLAVLSDQSPPLFHYFKQLFAQVTNPAIDPIREGLVMSLRTVIGGGGNTFEETPEACHTLVLDSPVLANAHLEAIAGSLEGYGVFEPKKLSMLYEPDGPDSLETALDGLCRQAIEAVDEGYNLLVLTDRGVDARRIAMPSLLALSAVHQCLIREGTRLLTGLVVETAEAREVHHFAALIGFGAAAVNPWLAFDTIRGLCADGRLDLDPDEAIAHYIKAIDKGLLKVMSKMGISTIESYRGAQIFECVGLDAALVDRVFTGTPSRIEGVGLAELDLEARERHARGFGPDMGLDPDDLPAGGDYLWRRRGERHKWNPGTVARLQAAVRLDDAAAWAEYAALASDETDGPATLRGMLEFVPAEPVPLDEVEPEEAIMARFCTGAMSFGSISAAAHETLAVAMNRIGGRSNTGEGGEESERYARLPGGDSKRSAIKQVASARFGVHAEYLVNADELQIKVAQGAKPGEGGQLPGHKVTERIARVRCSTPGVTLISPPPHHDIYSIEDLAQLIFDLKAVNREARVSVKLVSEVGVGTIAAGVAKARADLVTIAGDTGGTGASPLSSIKHAGLPWELGLAETQQVLVQNDLRGRVKVQVDGGLRTGRDVLVAGLLGAEEFGFATAPLVALGCILLRKCHLNTCSVGIATQDPDLEERFAGDPVHVERFFRFVAREVRQGMAALGFRTFDDLVGRVDRLRTRTDVGHWKARSVDLSAMLAPPVPTGTGALRCVTAQADVHADHLDRRLLERLGDAIDKGRVAQTSSPIGNMDRAVGAMLSGAVARKYGRTGLPDDTITVDFQGSAGQSFGAWLARGLTFRLEGEANDYLGKGLSGGRIVAFPPRTARYVAEDNVLVGNTVLYGATSGQVFLRGLAGERFAVRNSGAQAVVEGVGDHGCEYMTGGVVLVLGPTGRNFAAGMSGGMAYVFDRDGDFRKKCNTGMVELESLIEESDLWLVYGMLEDHAKHTGSTLARRILDNWELMVPRFVKVMPTEYKRALQQRRARMRRRLDEEAANTAFDPTTLRRGAH